MTDRNKQGLADLEVRARLHALGYETCVRDGMATLISPNGRKVEMMLQDGVLALTMTLQATGVMPTSECWGQVAILNSQARMAHFDIIRAGMLKIRATFDMGRSESISPFIDAWVLDTGGVLEGGRRQLAPFFIFDEMTRTPQGWIEVNSQMVCKEKDGKGRSLAEGT